MTVYSRHIAEDVLDDRRLGRHVHHDPRSRNFEAEASSKIISVVHAGIGLPLNQGTVGKCTCEAVVEAGNANPNKADLPGGTPRNDHDSDGLYELETKLEGHPWLPARPSVNDIGGSGLMVCRAAKQLGWIKSYHHAFGLDHALKALVLRPSIFGVDWYDSFDEPDSNGEVKITPHASIRGGHEICGLEIDAPAQRVWFPQSWGLQYGVARPSIGLPNGGAFCMSFDTLGQLLASQGDCTVPVFA